MTLDLFIDLVWQEREITTLLRTRLCYRSINLLLEFESDSESGECRSIEIGSLGTRNRS